MTGTTRWTALALLIMTPLSTAGAMRKIPAFARKYGLSCSVCHAPAPRLTDAGNNFANNGFEFAPGEEPRDTINTGDPLLRLQRALPLAVRVDMYANAVTKAKPDQTTVDLQSPWVIKLLSGGQIANKVSYYTYFLLTERGEVAGLEDAYVQFSDVGGSGVNLLVGQFQVSDPMFKRELRLGYEDYQPYRVRVGEVRADLTYERGLMAMMNPWSGGSVALEVVSGRGLDAASGSRSYDRDKGKNVAARFSQDIGSWRVGAFGYAGSERSGGVTSSIRVWGPDATVPLGSIGEVNVQYLYRRDGDPFLGACTPATPCPGGATAQFHSVVHSTLAEATLWPKGEAGRVFVSALYNYIDSKDPVISLRLGEQDGSPGYLKRYHTAAAGLHYLYRRNVRFLWEAGWDFEREQARLTTGAVMAF
jgi:hypothetical protein